MKKLFSLAFLVFSLIFCGDRRLPRLSGSVLLA